MSGKKERILLNCGFLKLTLYKAGKGEPFHWKPLPVGHYASLHKLHFSNKERYEFYPMPPEGKELKPVLGDVYDLTSYLITTRIQLFWLGYIFELELKPEAVSRRKFTPIDYGKTAVVHP